MAAVRPKWRGTLTIGLVSVPMHLFATSEKKGAAPTGHAVHRTCQTQSNSRKWCPVCEVEISEEELMTGYDVPSGLQGPKMHVETCTVDEGEECLCPRSAFVELPPASIAGLKAESSKVILIRSTADAGDLEPLMIAETMFLVGDGTAAAAEAEAIVMEAMRGKVGIGTLVMSGKERHVALMVYRGTLLLHVLRTADQMKAFPARVILPAANEQMVGLAKQLIASMEAPLDLSETRDTYADGLKALVAESCGGEVVAVEAQAPPAAVTSLMDALLASVKAVPATKATKKKEPKKNREAA